MPQPLFDKPLYELRETFVRARFAEPSVFGRPDIEQWLHKSTHHIDDPVNSTSEWSAIGFLDHLESELSNAGARVFAAWIRDNATELQNPPEAFHTSRSYAETFSTILDVLRVGGAVIYQGWSRKHDAWLVLIIDNNAFVAEFKGADHILTLRPATIMDVERVLGAEVMANRPKRDQALEWLTTEYTHAIAMVRALARRDFNEAVAVSTDGTKIVKAEEVAVILNEDRLMIFPASAFKPCKILRAPGQQRLDVPQAPRGCTYAEWILRYDLPKSLWTTRGQFLDTSPYLNKRIFVTERRFCPSPLPDGGREMRV